MARVYQLERETDGRWIAELLGEHGIVQYGNTPTEAIAAIDEHADSEPEYFPAK